MFMGIVLFIMGIFCIWASKADDEDFDLMGYRTPQSTENLRSWKVSNTLFGILGIIFGIALFILSLVFTFNFWISFGVWFLFVFIDILITEVFLHFYSKNNPMK